MCNCDVDETAELDHITPLYKSTSTNSLDNAQLLCCTCHRPKTQREEAERVAELRAAIVERQAAAPLQAKTESENLESVLTPVNNFDFALYAFVGTKTR